MPLRVWPTSRKRWNFGQTIPMNSPRAAPFSKLSGRREDAIADFQRALAKDEDNKESKLGLARLGALPQPLDEIEALHEHLVKLDNDKKTEEAIAVAKEYAHAIEVREGTDKIDYAFAIRILVDLYVAEARFDEAEPLARQALEIRERLPVSDQMEVSRSLTALAGVLLGRSKLADAEGFLRQALEIRQRVLRPDHSFFATIVSSFCSSISQGVSGWNFQDVRRPASHFLRGTCGNRSQSDEWSDYQASLCPWSARRPCRSPCRKRAR